jgi:hypothetical protein
MSALNTVQKFFPGVKKVVDADKPADIEVTISDATTKGIKNHEACAMAVACKRKYNLDGVIISRSTAYLVKGNQARRFKLPPATAKEVVSFDRGGGFAPGVYRLSAVGDWAKLGRKQGSDKPRTGNGIKERFRHLTTDIRTVLGGADPDSSGNRGKARKRKASIG